MVLRRDEAIYVGPQFSKKGVIEPNCGGTEL